MQLKLDDIPTLTGGQPAGAEPVRRRLPGGAPAWIQPRWSRRGFVKAAATVGTGVGLAALGVLPPARKARAENFDILDACPGYAANHNCSPGCGPSPVCADCCLNQGACNQCTCPKWHRNANAGNVQYRFRPNQCVRGQGWDGWNWHFVGACGCCRSSIKYRCHDGTKKVGGAAAAPTICRSVVGCANCNCSP